MAPPTSYAKRLVSTVIIATVVSLVSLCEYLQMTYIYSDIDAGVGNIMQTIALSAYMDMLLVSVCVSAYAIKQLYQMVIGIRASAYGSALQEPHAAKETATRMICLASPADCDSLTFRDKCRLYRVQAEQAQKPPPPAVVYMTPATLWCNMYTISTAMFVVGYSIHGGHPTASVVFASSSVACAVIYSLLEAKRLDGPQIVQRVASGMFLITSVTLVGLSMRGYDRTAATETVKETQSITRVIESLWLSQILPAVAPVALCLCRLNAEQKQVANVSAPTVVSLSLPFICALSICYLSVYTPLHAAWLDMQLEWVNVWLQGGTNTTTHAIVHESRFRAEWGYMMVVWIVGPLLTWGKKLSYARVCCMLRS